MFVLVPFIILIKTSLGTQELKVTSAVYPHLNDLLGNKTFAINVNLLNLESQTWLSTDHSRGSPNLRQISARVPEL